MKVNVQVQPWLPLCLICLDIGEGSRYEALQRIRMNVELGQWQALFGFEHGSRDPNLLLQPEMQVAGRSLNGNISHHVVRVYW